MQIKHGRTKSIVLSGGYRGQVVSVEALVKRGLPGLQINGLVQGRESADRIRSALVSSGVKLPLMSFLVQMTPTDLRIKGSHSDLAVATALLLALRVMPTGSLLERLDSDLNLFLGELSLAGEVCKVRNILPLLLEAKRQGWKKVVLPKDNLSEARIVSGMQFTGISDLSDLFVPPGPPDNSFVSFPPQPEDPQATGHLARFEIAPLTKRGLGVAAAGRHSLLLIGPPGTGKSALAREVSALLPPPDEDERLEILALRELFSANWEKNAPATLPVKRPLRVPHHTCTANALVGGGVPVSPGEVTRSHNGVLLLDELAEFSRRSLQSLREPLEEGRVTVSRGTETASFPARFHLVATTNPCPCGHMDDPHTQCCCTTTARRNYLGRILGPLEDRIEISLHVRHRDPGKGETGPTLAEIREWIRLANGRQKARFRNTALKFNADIPAEDLERLCPFADKDAEEFFEGVVRGNAASHRTSGAVLRVARTIADMETSETIGEGHLREALALRCLHFYRREIGGRAG